MTHVHSEQIDTYTINITFLSSKYEFCRNNWKWMQVFTRVNALIYIHLLMIIKINLSDPPREMRHVTKSIVPQLLFSMSLPYCYLSGMTEPIHSVCKHRAIGFNSLQSHMDRGSLGPGRLENFKGWENPHCIFSNSMSNGPLYGPLLTVRWLQWPHQSSHTHKHQNKPINLTHKHTKTNPESVKVQHLLSKWNLGEDGYTTTSIKTALIY